MRPLQLNGFRIDLSSDEVAGRTRSMTDNRDLRDLRAAFDGRAVLHWDKGVLYSVATLPEGDCGELGETATFTCANHLALLARLVDEALPAVFHSYPIVRRRPLGFQGRRTELIAATAADFPALASWVGRMTGSPYYEVNTKITELQNGAPFLGLFIRARTRWAITAQLSDLAAAGIELSGLDVVRRKPADNERTLVGRIDRLANGVVHLAESMDDTVSIAAEDVAVDGSRRSFVRVLRTILGGDYERFEEERRAHEDELLDGPALEGLVDRTGRFLHESPALVLGGALSATVGARIRAENTRRYTVVSATRDVQYCFDAARTKTDTMPWRGIRSYGPFSRETFTPKSPKILVLFPDNHQGPVERFLRSLRDGVRLERSAYDAGFASTFGLVNVEFELLPVRLTRGSVEMVSQSYRRVLDERFASDRRLPDAAIVVIPDEFAGLPDRSNPYLHTKARLLLLGVPSQELRTATIRQDPRNLQYTLQSIAVQLYAKLGGTPWTVDQDPTINDEIVVGVGTCELGESRFRERRRYVGITTVFRGDGNYLLGTLSQECSFEEYPTALRNSITSTLADIRDRNAWRAGDRIRIVTHTPRDMKHVDLARTMADAVEAAGRDQTVEFAFATIGREHPFIALDPAEHGVGKPERRKGELVPMRGTIVQVGRYSRLLTTAGPSLVKRPGSPMPHPLLVRLHKHSTFRDVDYVTQQALRFTSLSWRSTLPAREPVTIQYSRLIANLLGRLRAVDDWSPAVLNSRLRTSRWFL